MPKNETVSSNFKDKMQKNKKNFTRNKSALSSIILYFRKCPAKELL